MCLSLHCFCSFLLFLDPNERTTSPEHGENRCCDFQPINSFDLLCFDVFFLLAFCARRDSDNSGGDEMGDDGGVGLSEEPEINSGGL